MMESSNFTLSSTIFSDDDYKKIVQRLLIFRDLFVCIIYRNKIMATTVTWVLDANSKYEISSKEHLLQLMNEGILYTNTGSVPGQWYGEDYIQTADIDLEGDSTNIKPIGGPVGFSGEYDGNGFTVSNWSYIDPNFGTGTTRDMVGFFDLINRGTLKNFRLAGVCTLSGFGSRGGMIAGYLLNSSTMYNVELDLSPGSYITQGDQTTVTVCQMGTVVGHIESASCSAIAVTFKGEIDSITHSANLSQPYVGGVVGNITGGATCTLFRNLGTFPSGLSGFYVGGVVGHSDQSSFTKLLNAMTGDITSGFAGFIGGIIGRVRQTNISQEFHTCVNSMKGNITSTSTGYSSGIVGIFVQKAGSTVHSLMNYMNGDITSSTAKNSAGLIAYGIGENTTTSINAMNGEVYNSVISIVSSGSTVLATLDASFGLLYAVDSNSTTTPVTGLSTDADNGLPIVDLSETTPDGATQTFEFVFGNGSRTFNQLKIESSGEYFNFSELEIYDMSGTNVSVGHGFCCGFGFWCSRGWSNGSKPRK